MKRPLVFLLSLIPVDTNGRAGLNAQDRDEVFYPLLHLDKYDGPVTLVANNVLQQGDELGLFFGLLANERRRCVLRAELAVPA